MVDSNEPESKQEYSISIHVKATKIILTKGEIQGSAKMEMRVHGFIENPHNHLLC